LEKELPPELLEAMEIVQYHKGEYFFFQEERLKQLYLLVEGKLQVDYLQSTGVRQSILSKPLSRSSVIWNCWTNAW
jgi:CRP-like cAMP-binding protein